MRPRITPGGFLLRDASGEIDDDEYDDRCGDGGEGA
jgi:hypothetical protein